MSIDLVVALYILEDRLARGWDRHIYEHSDTCCIKDLKTFKDFKDLMI